MTTTDATTMGVGPDAELAGEAVPRAPQVRAGLVEQCERAARHLYDAEIALHHARQTQVDGWISAAYAKLHDAVEAHTEAVVALSLPSTSLPLVEPAVSTRFVGKGCADRSPLNFLCDRAES